jgi:hypothetical protein
MPPVVYAILSALGALFRSQRTLRVENMALRSATSAGDLSANRQATAYSTRGPHPVVVAIAALGPLAGGSGFRSARDRHRMATQTLS